MGFDARRQPARAERRRSGQAGPDPTRRPGKFLAGHLRRQGRWYLVLAAMLLAVFGLYWLEWRTFTNFVAALDHDAAFMPDFVRHYYPMSSRILRVPQPVAGYVYPAFFAILMSPLGLLPLKGALAAWVVFQVGAAAALSALSARLLGFGPRGTVLLAGLFVTSFPVLHNFKWGQVSVPVTAGLVGAYLLAERRRPIAAGILLGLATATKLYPAMFALTWLSRSRLRALTAFAAATTLFYGVLPAVLLGPARWVAFEKATSFAIEPTGGIRFDVNSHYIAYVGARWFTIFTGQAAPAAFSTGLTIVGWLVAAGLVALLRPALRRDDLRVRGLPLVLLFVTVPFLIRTSWPHYFVCLPLCQAALLDRMLPVARRGGMWGWLWLLLPVGSMALASIFLFNVFPTWGMYNTCGLLFFANLLLVPACALVVLRRDGVDRSSGRAASIPSR